MPGATEGCCAVRRVGYVAKVFPRLSETFVLNEIHELERQGIDVHVFSLHAPPAAVPHRLLSDLRAPVTCVESCAEPSRTRRDETMATLSAGFSAEASLGDRLFPRHYVRLAARLRPPPVAARRALPAAPVRMSSAP